MILFFDKNDLVLNVKLGALETYTCTDEIKDIVDRVTALKKERDEFLNNIYSPKLKQLLEAVEKVNCAENPTLKDVRN